MEITIDLTGLPAIANYRPDQLFWYLFINGGWIFLLIGFLILSYHLRLELIRFRYLKSIKYTILATDIPKENEQSLLAVEQLFAQLHGIRSGPTLWERYGLGKTQLTFSMEIVAIEGYIQFLIRTPEQYRDLVEAAIYAQYPDAEITEVEDYIKLIPDDVHEIKSDYNLWGVEFALSKNSGYPIKTYKYFEHGLEQVFIDPMASLLEVMSKLGKGEIIGFQIIIAPVNDDWKGRAKRIVAKLVGAKISEKENVADRVVKTSLGWLEKFSETIYQLWGNIPSAKDREGIPSLMQYLTSGEKFVVEAIENKISRLAFASTFRIFYLARNEVYKKGLGVNAILGAVNQFNTTDLNAFKKHKIMTTEADYFFIKKRISIKQKRLIRLFKERSRKGSNEFYLSTEELATLYHFPIISVKAPLLKRTEWKKAVPPTALPTEQPPESIFSKPSLATKITEVLELETPPTGTAIELPIKEYGDYTISESLPGYNFDDDYYEKRFAKNKSADTKNNEQKEKASLPPNLPFVE